MDEPFCCRKCGAVLAADVPAGLCPKCLVKAGLGNEAESEAAVVASNPAVHPTEKSPAGPKPGFEPPSPEELAPLFPQLEFLKLLGKGGMGAVYKARQRGLDRLVAVKILPPEIGRNSSFAERFTREARALARLSHPHIVAVYDFGQTDGLFYIVMEYVDGVNLRQTIQSRGLEPQQALAIVPQVCEALQFAHDEGIVHRDIKPENILIDQRGRVKIADFGLAKLLGQDPHEHLLTGTHQVMGTLRYMAPEQMQGAREVDHRADIYSLGVVFYELLTGELPMGRFAPPSKKVQIDVRLDEIVLRALEQQPEQRYQQASEIRDDVEKVTAKTQDAPQTPASAPQSLDAGRNGSSRETSDAWGFLKGPSGRGARLRVSILAAVLLLIVVAPFIKISARELSLSASMVLLLLSLMVLGGVSLTIFHDWRDGRSPLVWKGIRTVLLLVFALCFVSFFGTAGAFSGVGTSFTIGFPFPWFEASTGDTFKMNVILASWEWAIFAAGWLSLYAWGKSPGVPSSSAVTPQPWPSNPVRAGDDSDARHERKSRILAGLVAACVIGIAACLWPHSVIDHSFLGLVSHGERPPLPGVVIDPDTNAFGELGEWTPASRAGVIKGDTILSMGGKDVHIWGVDNPNRIWQAIPVETDVAVTVLRKDKTIVLRTIRSPDPITVCFYANWQFLVGFCFLFFVVVALLIPPSGDANRRRGIVATLVGLFLVMILVFGSGTFLDQPAKELWNLYSAGYNYSATNYEAKLSAGLAAVALLLLGIFDVRRSFKRQISNLDELNAGAEGKVPPINQIAGPSQA